MVGLNLRKAALPLAAGLLLSVSAPAHAQSANGVGSPFELAFWQSVAGSDDPAVYDAYLQQYPAGTFAGLARAKLATLRKAPISPAAVAPVAAPAVAPVAAPAAQLTPAVATVVSQPAPPSAPPTLVAATAPVAAPVPMQSPAEPKPAVVAAPKAATAEASDVTSDANLLLELARSQEVGGGTDRVAAANGFALPARPVLTEIADLSLPTSFCSAEQRNAFYETRYKPHLDLARANNDAAIAHMQKLQQAYDSFQLSRDPSPMNALAAEASSYQQQVAAAAYARQAAVVRQFDQLMALPITACQIATATK
ncbi:hypothetical protein ACQKO5_06845 [Novosphingobium subterraneum]|uniref:hypothetical protein n=1 Tax=Novosphingobium subterraneum TaxID=48936 RepID=UPI003CFD4FD2